MDPSRIAAISFDLDDTLWPFLPCLVRAEGALMNWLIAHAPATASVLDSPAALRPYRDRAVDGHPHLRHDLSELRRVAIRTLLHDVGEDVALAEPAFDVFFAERLRVELYEDVLPALVRLSRRYPLVALTNGNACIHKAGLTEHFKGSLNAGNLGAAKPDAEVFKAAASLAGVETSQLLHVGDDWALDVEGALKAGAQAAWVVRQGDEPVVPPTEAPAPVVVRDLAALCELLACD